MLAKMLQKKWGLISYGRYQGIPAKKEKNEKKDSKDFKREIRAHRLKVILRSGCVIGVIAALTVTAVTLLKIKPTPATRSCPQSTGTRCPVLLC